MAARPKRIPQWATDAAYAAVGKAWDGAAPTLEPPDGLKAEGWEPAVAPNARFINWLFNQLGGWVAYLADLGARNWTDRTTAFAASDSAGITGLRRAVFDAGSTTVAPYGPQVLVLGAAAGGHAPPAMASLDGEYWIDTQSGVTSTNYDLRDGVYAEGETLVTPINKWVIVGGDSTGTGVGHVFTHPRDLTSGVWTPRTAAESAQWRAIAHGADALHPLVIVGTGGKINSSDDGTTWAARTSGVTTTLNAVAYGAGVFVAVGDNGVVLTSTTGAAWTARTASGAADLQSVVYEPRSATWLAIDSAGAIYTSVDAAGWSLCAAPPTFHLDGNPQLTTDGAGTVYAFEATGTPGGTYVHVSTDGGATWGERIWITRRIPDEAAADVAYCGALGWICVGPYAPGSPSTGFVRQSVRL